MKLTEDQLMTVGELRSRLEEYPDDMRIFFGCFSLEFYRFKIRGDKLLQMEFSQTVSEDSAGRVSIENHY